MFMLKNKTLLSYGRLSDGAESQTFLIPTNQTGGTNPNVFLKIIVQLVFKEAQIKGRCSAEEPASPVGSVNP